MSLTSHLVSVNTHGLRPFVDCPPTSSFVRIGLQQTLATHVTLYMIQHDSLWRTCLMPATIAIKMPGTLGWLVIGLLCCSLALALSLPLSLSLSLSLSPALSLSHSLCSCLSPSRPLDILHACLPVFLLSFPSCLPSYFLLASLYTSLACKVRPYVFPLLCLMGSSCVCETVIVYLLFCGRVCD